MKALEGANQSARYDRSRETKTRALDLSLQTGRIIVSGLGALTFANLKAIFITKTLEYTGNRLLTYHHS